MAEDRIEEYLRHLDAIGRAKSTIDTYGEILRRMDADRDRLPYGLTGANNIELKAWIYVPGRPPATRHLYRACVVGFFAWATDPDDPWLDFDPARRLPSVRVPRGKARPASTEQLRDILARARDPYRVWYLLAAGEGCRCIEISNLDREHITQDAMWLQGKGGKTRTVYTHPAVWAAVRELPPGPIARRHRSGARADRRNVDQRGNYQLQKVLGHDLTMHQLRKWFATHAHRAAGGDLAVTQELLGHASPDTTRIYVDVDEDAKRAAIAGLPLPI